MRAFYLVPLALIPLIVALAGCSPRIPESGAGTGDYNSYVKGATVAPAGTPPDSFSTDAAAAAIDASGSGSISTAPLSATTGFGAAGDAGQFDPNRPRGDAPTTIAADSGEMTQQYATAGLSDEQSFKAVTERTSIEGDKERIAANRAQYVTIQPTDVPQHPDNTGPDIVKFALATTNPVGAQLYDRPSFYLVNVKTACQKFTSPDFAQQAFLGKGGPQKDPKGLDPDGDGFACAWDPTPFRNALQQ